MNHLPPHLQRRTFLKLGIASAVVLAVVGGAVALIQPGLVNGKLSPSARLVMTRVAQAMLAGTLPADAAGQLQALDRLLERMNALVAGMPAPVQAELSELLSLLPTAAGRRGLVGLSPSWEDTTVAQTSEALQNMRVSSIALKQQAYLGLHDLVFAPYFSGEESWDILGYPGPIPV
jgi:hypothetical protein